MTIPPKGDPRRPLHLAIRSMRLLGGILILFATCATVPMLVLKGRGAAAAPPVLIVLGLMFYVVPGVCFIVLSIFLARRQFWAVVASICMASVACLFALVMFVGLVIVAAIPWISIGFLKG